MSKAKEIREKVIEIVRTARALRGPNQCVVLNVLVGDPDTTDWSTANTSVLRTSFIVRPEDDISGFARSIAKGLAGKPFRFRFEALLIDIEQKGGAGGVGQKGN